MMGSMSLFRAVLITALAVSAASCSKSDSGDTPTSRPIRTLSLTPCSAPATASASAARSSALRSISDAKTAPATRRRIRRRFQADGRTVSYLNLSGPRSRALACDRRSRRSIGARTRATFVERYPPFVPPGTTHVTIFAGGNDANIIGSAVSGGPGRARHPRLRRWTGSSVGQRSGRVRQSRAQPVVHRADRRLQPAEPGRRTVHGGTHRPGAQHHAAHRHRPHGPDQQPHEPRRLVVDLMCDPRLPQPASYSSDGFHPSDAGYAIMAELGYAALTSGAAPAPRTSTLRRQRAALPVFLGGLLRAFGP